MKKEYEPLFIRKKFLEQLSIRRKHTAFSYLIKKDFY